MKARARSRYRRICYGEGHPPEDGLRRFEFLLSAHLTFIIADNFFCIAGTHRLPTSGLLRDRRNLLGLRLSFLLCPLSVPLMASPRVLISDDHAVVRRGLRTILEDSLQFEVCGEAVDGSRTLQLAAQLAPDILILDISMPPPNGLEVAAQLRQTLPDIKLFPGPFLCPDGRPHGSEVISAGRLVMGSRPASGNRVSAATWTRNAPYSVPMPKRSRSQSVGCRTTRPSDFPEEDFRGVRGCTSTSRAFSVKVD